MDDLVDRLRIQVERATVPIDASEVRTTGGARRSRFLNVAAVAALLAVVVGVVVVRSDRRETGPPTAGEASSVSVERIQVRSNPDGSQKVSIVFDGPLPDDQVSFVEDITSIGIPGLGFAVQGPSGLHVCQDVHWFGDGATGSIDVLIPSEWVAPRTHADQLVPRFDPPVGVDAIEHPGKIVACGPYRGYFQYSIWGPASDDPNDVRVSVSADSTRVVVEVQPERTAPDDSSDATGPGTDLDLAGEIGSGGGIIYGGREMQSTPAELFESQPDGPTVVFDATTRGYYLVAERHGQTMCVGLRPSGSPTPSAERCDVPAHATHEDVVRPATYLGTGTIETPDGTITVAYGLTYLDATIVATPSGNKTPELVSGQPFWMHRFFAVPVDPADNELILRNASGAEINRVAIPDS